MSRRIFQVDMIALHTLSPKGASKMHLLKTRSALTFALCYILIVDILKGHAYTFHVKKRAAAVAAVPWPQCPNAPMAPMHGPNASRGTGGPAKVR